MDKQLLYLAQTLHTLMCDKEHATDMSTAIGQLTGERDGRLCYYYLEESVANAESLPDHAHWIGEAERLCKDAGLSPDDMIAALGILLKLRADIQKVEDRYQGNVKRLISIVLRSLIS